MCCFPKKWCLLRLNFLTQFLILRTSSSSLYDHHRRHDHHHHHHHDLWKSFVWRWSRLRQQLIVMIITIPHSLSSSWCGIWSHLVPSFLLFPILSSQQKHQKIQRQRPTSSSSNTEFNRSFPRSALLSDRWSSRFPFSWHYPPYTLFSFHSVPHSLSWIPILLEFDSFFLSSSLPSSPQPIFLVILSWFPIWLLLLDPSKNPSNHSMNNRLKHNPIARNLTTASFRSAFMLIFVSCSLMLHLPMKSDLIMIIRVGLCLWTHILPSIQPSPSSTLSSCDSPDSWRPLALNRWVDFLPPPAACCLNDFIWTLITECESRVILWTIGLTIIRNDDSLDDEMTHDDHPHCIQSNAILTRLNELKWIVHLNLILLLHPSIRPSDHSLIQIKHFWMNGLSSSWYAHFLLVCPWYSHLHHRNHHLTCNWEWCVKSYQTKPSWRRRSLMPSKTDGNQLTKVNLNQRKLAATLHYNMAAGQNGQNGQMSGPGTPGAINRMPPGMVTSSLPRKSLEMNQDEAAAAAEALSRVITFGSMPSYREDKMQELIRHGMVDGTGVTRLTGLPNSDSLDGKEGNYLWEFFLPRKFSLSSFPSFRLDIFISLNTRDDKVYNIMWCSSDFSVKGKKGEESSEKIELITCHHDDGKASSSPSWSPREPRRVSWLNILTLFLSPNGFLSSFYDSSYQSLMITTKWCIDSRSDSLECVFSRNIDWAQIRRWHKSEHSCVSHSLREKTEYSSPSSGQMYPAAAIMIPSLESWRKKIWREDHWLESIRNRFLSDSFFIFISSAIRFIWAEFIVTFLTLFSSITTTFPHPSISLLLWPSLR